MVPVRGVSDTRSTGSVLSLVSPMHPGADAQLAHTSAAKPPVRVPTHFLSGCSLGQAPTVQGPSPALPSPALHRPMTVRAAVPASPQASSSSSAQAGVQAMGSVHLVSGCLVRGSPPRPLLSVLTAVIPAHVLIRSCPGLLAGPPTSLPALVSSTRNAPCPLAEE